MIRSGSAFGDRLLQEISERIVQAAGGNRLVARIGGAEFAIVLQDAKDLNGVISVAEQIVNQLAAEYSFFGHSLNVSCTLGISLYPNGWADSESLIKTADIAMCASRRWSQPLPIFTDAMNDKVQESLRIEHGLQMALARNELFLVYQPQVDARTGEVTGLEALLRWNHPQSGIVPPGKFIGVAEMQRAHRPHRRMGSAHRLRPGAQVAGCRAAPRPDRGQCFGRSSSASRDLAI